jgi:hypothetical protein
MLATTPPKNIIKKEKKHSLLALFEGVSCLFCQICQSTIWQCYFARYLFGSVWKKDTPRRICIIIFPSRLFNTHAFFKCVSLHHYFWKFCIFLRLLCSLGEFHFFCQQFSRNPPERWRKAISFSMDWFCWENLSQIFHDFPMKYGVFL